MNFKIDPEVREAFKNTKVYSFAFGKTATTPMELKTVHRCPACHRVITDMEEIAFMNYSGMCGTCDHVQADVDYSNSVEYGEEIDLC